MKALLGLVMAVVVIAGCAAQPDDEDFAGLVAIGNGRGLFLDCHGSGSPTAFIIPGKGSYAAEWNAVMRSVAKTTRVCAYDRPNTRPDGSDRSTPVPQPHTVQQDVEDLVKLIAAVELSTPIVVVAHSYGGLIADLLARTHPTLVSGLVFVDPTSEYLPRLGRADQDAEFDQAARTATPDGEAFFASDAFVALKAAPPLALPRVPAVVLSSDMFPPRRKAAAQDYTKYQIHRANSVLAETLWADNLIVPASGYSVMRCQPQLVAAKIIAIVAKVRASS
ncbi:MAG TPA: alpha/beta hydrolase [Mycobacterium sp.]|nr:alpha/beta hydrolase [Mycobacterium sp.]